MTLLDGSGSDGDVECRALRGRGQPNVEDDLAALPPLPEQDLCQMRAEASCGNSLVLFLIFLFVAPMQAYANTQANLTMVQRAWIFAIYAEAATAIFCLLGLMWDDPGTIKRTAENCFPLPDIVAETLANGQSLESVGNETGEDGRVFCIRCLVWRPDDGGNTHHCSTCQRCVCEFDHHCGVRAARASLARNTSPPPDDASDPTPPSSPHLPTTTRAIQRLPLPPICPHRARPMLRPRATFDATYACFLSHISHRSSAGASRATAAAATWGTSKLSS